jgi:glucoamylase
MTVYEGHPESPLAIEDYGMIGDCTTAALVGLNGSIDWLCWPRFDSGACFAALLGDRSHGRWVITSTNEPSRISRSYRGETMILETIFETEAGAFAVIDFMPIADCPSSLIRIVEGRRGKSHVCMNMTLRFDYGSAVPWVEGFGDKTGIVAIAGPNLVVLRATVELHGEPDLSTAASFDIVRRPLKSMQERSCEKPRRFGKTGPDTAPIRENTAMCSSVRFSP